MLSKLVQRQLPYMVNTTMRSFRAAAVVNRKPSIGDAVTILQSKVSSINQVVSKVNPYFVPYSQLIKYLTQLFFKYRMTLKNSVPLSLLVMVLQESSVS